MNYEEKMKNSVEWFSKESEEFEKAFWNNIGDYPPYIEITSDPINLTKEELNKMYDKYIKWNTQGA